MTIEEEYYENDSFWNNESAREIDRIKSTSELIPSDVESILDVGCGNGLFLNYLNNNFKKYSRLHGVDRSETALRYVKTAKTKSSIDSLPFCDNEFCLVSALEVIEHLPNNIFRKGLNELCRVSDKYILISVPNKESLERTLIGCPQCKTMFNPDYHLRSFNENILIDLLEEFEFKCNEIHYIGTYNEYPLVSKIFYKIRSLKHRNNPFAFELPCPVCRNYLEAKASSSSDDMHLPMHGCKELLKKLLPKNIKYLWISGIYERI